MRSVFLAFAVVAWGCGDGGGSDPADARSAADATIAADAASSPDAAGTPATPDAAPAPPDAAQPPDAAPPPEACSVGFLWDPRAATGPETFPDDFYTRPDPGTATGLRLDMGPERAPWVASLPPTIGGLYGALPRLDGWGTTAGISLRFTGPVAPPAEGALRLLTAGADGGPPEEVGFDVERVDDDAGLILWPTVPLRPGTRYAVVVTHGLTARDGGCVAPSGGFTDALSGVAPLEQMGQRFTEALSWAGLSPADAVGVAAFTTQTIEDESVAIAADIAGRSYAWATRPTCIDGPLYRECDGTFLAQDYRGADGVVDGTAPVATYELFVRAWLPLGDGGPRPVVIFGPGLGADLDISRGIAEVTAPLDVVTVAIDAPAHGRHPIADPTCEGQLCRVTGFFAVDLGAQTIDPLVARDHFRESTYDKLQLVRLLRSEADLDADGRPDIDASRLSYFAASLGGIMGPEFLALTSEVSAAVLNVPGGRVASIMADGQATALLVRSLVPPGTTPGDKARLFPLIQTLLDRGDPANFAPHILFDRLPGAGAQAQDLLVNMGMSDQVIPTSSTRALARALRIPHVPPIFQDFGLEVVAGEAPISGNLDDGQTTAGLFQFDRGVPAEGGPVAPADHGVGLSTEGRLQITHFLQTWAEGGLPEIVDPYALLSTPPLP